MEHGHNTTYVRYSYEDGPGEFRLTLHPMCNYRDYHSMTRGRLGWDFEVEEADGGYKVTANEGATPFWLTTSPPAAVTRTGVWYWNFVYRREVERGYPDKEDLYMPCVVRATLRPGDTLTLIASTEPPEATAPALDDALERERARQRALLRTAGVGREAAEEATSLPEG